MTATKGTAMTDHTQQARGRAPGWVRRLLSDERGLAVITVTLVGVVVAGVMAVLMFNTMRNYRELRQERQYDEVLVLAESGLDEAIFELNSDNDFSTVEAMPAGLDEAAKKEWVITQARGLIPTVADNGEYVIVKPDGEDVVYAVAFSVSVTDPTAQIRILKADLEVTPPKPATPFLPKTGFASGKNLGVGGVGIAGVPGGAYAKGNLSKSNTKTEIAGCPQAWQFNEF